MDLKSKLEMYKKGQVSKPAVKPDTGRDIHNLLQGTVCSNEDGCCFIVENRYPLTYLHGGYSLGSVLDIQPQLLRFLGCETGGDVSIRDFLFLDTETTGLSGGTGTVAFLIGTGFFEEDAFVLRQYFMRDYDEEPAMLREFNELLAGYRGLVTFNGKAFDWNLLSDRFTFNRTRIALKNPLHLDLLFPSRRIWRLKLESCSLCSLEENILGEYRVGDVPGALIPSIYFRYLEDRDASEICKVMDHNRSDILSMAALLVKITRMLENPIAETDGEQELVGVGRIFEAGGEFDMTVDCFECCMDSELVPVKETAARRLSDIYKRKGDYSRAVEHWERMASGSGLLSLFPLVELAKYYEHKAKDIKKAIEIVEKAMQLSLRIGYLNNAYHGDLMKRYKRLKRKAERIGNG